MITLAQLPLAGERARCSGSDRMPGHEISLPRLRRADEAPLDRGAGRGRLDVGGRGARRASPVVHPADGPARHRAVRRRARIRDHRRDRHGRGSRRVRDVAAHDEGRHRGADGRGRRVAEGGLRARAPGGARGNPRLAEAGRRGHARRLRNVFRRAAQATHAEEPANRSGGDGCRADSAFQAVARVAAGGPLTGFFLAGRAARWLESILVHPGRTLAVLAVLAAAIAPPVATAQPGRPVADGRPPLISAESVLLLDPEGRTLFAKNPDEERAPASLVKLMTLYLAFEDIEAKRADLDELVPVSRYAAVSPRRT